MTDSKRMTATGADAALRALLADSRFGVLVTLRPDGRPQLSNIVYTFDADADIARVSVTANRAKTRNLARDPRASLHVTTPDFWHWVVAEGSAELSPLSTEPGDATGRELLALHDAVNDPHPDPDDFFRAMVDDERQVVRLHVERVYGQP